MIATHVFAAALVLFSSFLLFFPTLIYIIFSFREQKVQCNATMKIEYRISHGSKCHLLPSRIYRNQRKPQYSMDTWTGFCTRSIIDDIIFHFTGDTHTNSSVIKVNCENLLGNGELYFLCNFKAWRGLLACSNSCTSILQHLAHARGTTKGNTDADVAEKVNRYCQYLFTLQLVYSNLIDSC